MALIRRRPHALLQRDPFGGWLFDWPEFFRGFEPLRPVLAGQLQVEEFLDDGTLVVRVELPGIDPDKDLELTVSEGALHVRAERRQDKTVEDKQEYRSELRYGAFSRVLPLPAGTSEQDITASYTAGILRDPGAVRPAQGRGRQDPGHDHVASRTTLASAPTITGRVAG